MGVFILDKEAREKKLREELKRIVNIAGQEQSIHKMILFGSLATGNITGKSDIDLLVIQDTKAKPFKRTEELYQKISPNVALDLLVYNGDELNEMKKTSSFIRRILEEGIVIYAKESRG